jgi:ParB/RepB/Spo0J family partition protein
MSVSVVKRLSLRWIDPNPFRDLEGHPLRREQIEQLKASIRSNGFWEGLLVRPHPAEHDRYQLAFGHARLQAAIEAKIRDASFNVRTLDDDAMIRAMADENVSQFGRDEYATYREAVTAAAERMMEQVIADPSDAQKILRVPDAAAQPAKVIAEAVNSITNGEAPGERFIARYFNGTLPLAPIRLALREYRESGRLAAWHARHNPQATAAPPAPTLNSAALSRFSEVSHVQEFADTVQRLHIPTERQEAVAEQVIAALQEPEAVRPGQPRNKQLTRTNIRRVTAELHTQRAPSKCEHERRAAEARALSIENAVMEMSIGLQRAAKGSAELQAVALSLGSDVQREMTPTTLARFRECSRAMRDIGASLERAAHAGSTPNLLGGRNDGNGEAA